MSRVVIIALVLSVAGAAPAAAQAQRGAGRGDGLSLAEVVRTLDGYALVQAQDALQLSDAQYGTFVVRLRRLQELRRTHQQRRNRILQELGRLAGRGPAGAENAQAPPPDDAAIREQLKALRAQEEQAAAELRQAYDELDKVLDARQQARFRLFEERLERRKLDLIMRARQGAAGR